jgi:hypothetical protein
LPIKLREESLRDINEAMVRIGKDIATDIRGADVREHVLQAERIVSKRLVELDSNRALSQHRGVQQQLIFKRRPIWKPPKPLPQRTPVQVRFKS